MSKGKIVIKIKPEVRQLMRSMTDAKENAKEKEIMAGDKLAGELRSWIVIPNGVGILSILADKILLKRGEVSE